MHILIIILIIGFMIFIHELGHFTFAKLFKVPVSTFAIGFPPTLYSFKRGGTTYKLNAIPLGGYVNLSEEGKEDDLDNALVAAPLVKQIIILLGGIIFNVVSAFIILWIMFMCGVKVPSETGEVIVTSIESGMPAEGVFEVGDIIHKQDMPTGLRDFNSTEEFIRFISESNGEAAKLVIRRDGEMKSVQLVPKKVNDVYKVGIGLETISNQSFPPAPAFVQAGSSLWNIVSSTWDALGQLGHKLIRGQKGSLDGVSGPVGLVATGSKMLRTDPGETTLMLFVVLSLNLALLNLLPIPALDGGQVVISIVRKIVPEKYGSKIHTIANTIGVILLFALIAFVTFKDIVGLFK